MINFNQTDFEVRLQISNCCIADKASKFAVSLGTGSGNINCKLQELQVLEAMLEILSCYHVYDTENPDDFDLNCLTEEQVHAMFDFISQKCEICFQRPGFTYTE